MHTTVYRNSVNFAEVIVKLPAAVAIWLMCQNLMVYKFKPPQLSVLSFIFNVILIYIVYCNRNLYFKLKISSGEWRLEIHLGPYVSTFQHLMQVVTSSCLLSSL